MTLAYLLPDPASLVRWSVYKGLGFIVVTSLLLLVLMRRAFAAEAAERAALRLTERELQASEVRWSALVANAVDAILSVDEEGRVCSFNRAAEQLLDCTAAQALGQPVQRFLPDFDDRMQGARRSLRATCLNGSEVPVDAAISHWDGDRGARTTVILRDERARLAQAAEIARLQQLNAALSQINQAIVWSSSREELFPRICRILVEQGGFCMAWVGAHDARTQRIVPVAEFGDASAYLRGIQIYGDARPMGQGPTGTAFREARPYVCNDLLADPRTLPWRDEALRRGLRASAVFPISFRGQPCGTLSVYADEVGYFCEREVALLAEAAMDVSFALDNLAGEHERAQAQIALRREKEFSDKMIESMPGIVYFYDSGGRFLRWNQNFERVSGYSADEIAQMHPRDFFREQDQPLIEQRIAEVFALGQSSLQIPFRPKNGEVKPYLLTGNRVYFGEQLCLVGVGIDTSEQEHAKAQLLHLNEMLEHKVSSRTAELQKALVRAEAADHLKSAFLATMSHELRTPLNSIIGFTGIVLQQLAGPLNAEQSKQLGMVRSSARHLLELINDVLDLSKIEAGQLEVRAEIFELCALVERVLATVRPSAERKNLQLGMNDLDEAIEMLGDRRRLEQILLNLINNAIKFTHDGGVRVVVQRLALPGSPAPVPAVRISIIDTGIGISANDLPKLFQPFRQLDTGLARLHEGTGLGLAICRRLAHLLGGEITVQSTPACGSQFHVTLPLKSAVTP